jgi:hypothetical protein
MLFLCGWIVIGVGYQRAIDDPGDFDPGLAQGLTSAQIAEGWISLFDGKTTFGWRREVAADFRINEAAIEVASGPIGLLRTAAQFDDFVLKLEFFNDPDANGGVFIRTSPNPVSPVKDCYEVNIAPDSHPFPTGSIVGWQKASVAVNEALNDADWNQMVIRANGPRIQVEINGQTVTEFVHRGAFLQKGFIGLQHHTGRLRYRNISIQPLNLEPLFDGSSLQGWSDENRLECRALIAPPDTLRLIGGRGQLESTRQFGNFIFSTHVRTHVEGVNSGVFFRCIPGELMNGYESQIDNRFLDGDRRRPLDSGTGGIFRRQPARWVNASDGKWFAKTIVADGATICVWVNGYQVVDWTDRRQINRNPRRGLRLERGTIILQGHDPQTDLSFRRIRVRELKSRRR